MLEKSELMVYVPTAKDLFVSGSHRRRRPRPSWSKGSATSTVAVKSAAGVVVSTDCGLGSELK
jgi:hypothetical protein